jgi:hypothetical protein
MRSRQKAISEITEILETVHLPKSRLAIQIHGVPSRRRLDLPVAHIIEAGGTSRIGGDGKRLARQAALPVEAAPPPAISNGLAARVARLLQGHKWVLGSVRFASRRRAVVPGIGAAN